MNYSKLERLLVVAFFQGLSNRGSPECSLQGQQGLHPELSEEGVQALHDPGDQGLGKHLTGTVDRQFSLSLSYF